MTGLIDGSLSTLAPIFAIVLHTHNTFDAFIAGVATAIGAGISMAFSEGLSDTGELTGVESAVRGAITASDLPRRHPAHAAVPVPTYRVALRRDRLALRALRP